MIVKSLVDFSFNPSTLFGTTKFNKKKNNNPYSLDGMTWYKSEVINTDNRRQKNSIKYQLSNLCNIKNENDQDQVYITTQKSIKHSRKSAVIRDMRCAPDFEQSSFRERFSES